MTYRRNIKSYKWMLKSNSDTKVVCTAPGKIFVKNLSPLIYKSLINVMGIVAFTSQICVTRTKRFNTANIKIRHCTRP